MFKILKKIFTKNENVEEAIQSCEDESSELNKATEDTNVRTLKDLAKLSDLEGMTFWKFSQSKSGNNRISSASSYFEYYNDKEGQILYGRILQDENELEEAIRVGEAKLDEKGVYRCVLSFVRDKNIGNAYLYGDQITEIIISEGDANYEEYKDVEYYSLGDGIGELRAVKLSIGKTYPLFEISTISKIIELSEASTVGLLLSGSGIGSFSWKLSELKRTDETKVKWDKACRYIEFLSGKYRDKTKRARETAEESSMTIVAKYIKNNIVSLENEFIQNCE